MPQGIRIWDASGTLQVNEDASMGRLIGTSNTGTSNGSLAVAGFSTGIPFAFPSPYRYGPSAAVFTTNSTHLIWTFNTGITPEDTVFYYGVR